MLLEKNYLQRGNSVKTESHKRLKRVTRVHSVRIFIFAKYHIWNTEFFRALHTSRHTQQHFWFAVSHFNSDLNAVNYLQKLKNFFEGIQVKFCRLPNDD